MPNWFIALALILAGALSMISMKNPAAAISKAAFSSRQSSSIGLRVQLQTNASGLRAAYSKPEGSLAIARVQPFDGAMMYSWVAPKDGTILVAKPTQGNSRATRK